LGQEEGEIMMPFLVLSCFVLLFFCFFFLFTHLHALWFYILSSLALRCSYETFYSFVVSVHPPFYCFLVYSTTIGASFFFFLIPSSVNESATIRVWMLARAMAVADSLGDGLENTSATKEQSNCYICVDRDGDGFTGRRQDTLMIITSAVVTMSFKLSAFVHVNVGDPCLVSLIIAYQSWYWG
jgi:hypothetical protein